jgi:hypothetical protein
MRQAKGGDGMARRHPAGEAPAIEAFASAFGVNIDVFVEGGLLPYRVSPAASRPLGEAGGRGVAPSPRLCGSSSHLMSNSVGGIISVPTSYKLAWSRAQGF